MSVAPRSAAAAATTTHQQFAFFSSDDSHDDFAPKRKVVEGEDEALKMIAEHVKDNPIMLYMKGNPSMPMCVSQSEILWACDVVRCFLRTL